MSADREFAELEARLEGLERLVEELNLRLAALSDWIADVAAGAS